MSHNIPVRYDDSQDPLRRTRLQVLAEELIPDAFDDAKKLVADRVTEMVAPQLYAAVVAIDQNVGEAYSRSSGKERALRFEYALGETREAIQPRLSSQTLSGLSPHCSAFICCSWS